MVSMCWLQSASLTAAAGLYANIAEIDVIVVYIPVGANDWMSVYLAHTVNMQYPTT